MSQHTARGIMHFYCEKPLWKLFEKMAEETARPIDDLIREAMQAYAEQHGALDAVAESVPPLPEGDKTREIVSRDSQSSDSQSRTLRSRSPRSQSVAQPLERSPAANPKTLSPITSAQPTPLSVTRPAPVTPNPGGLRGKSFGESVAQWTGQPGTNSGITAEPADLSPVTQAHLQLTANGQTVTVDKDQFVIGRGSKYSDFVIKDPNVSRRHAVVVRRGGLWYLQDLGSTNGVEYKGMRIDNKRIDEGDVFRICEHEVRFSYHGE